MEWNLDSIYPGIDSQDFQSDVKELENVIAKINQLADEITKIPAQEAIRQYLLDNQKLSTLASSLLGYLSLRESINTSDAAAAKAEESIEEMINGCVGAITRIDAWLATLDIDAYLDDPLIKEHEMVLKETQKDASHNLSEKEEIIIAGMQQTGSSAFARLKDQLIGGHTVNLNGEEQPLTVVLNLAYSPDPQVRKAAYEAEIASYKKIETPLAACLNGIKGESLTIAKWRGYDSILDMTLEQSRMDHETLDAMFAAMKEYLPVFRHYLKAKAKFLGHDNGLPFYDLYAPVTKNEHYYSYEDACAFILKNFASFDQSLYDMAKRAIDNHWIDVNSRPGKVSGAFCSGVVKLKESRILLNFSHSFDSVVTLAHELGHAYHNECAKDVSILLKHAPMPLAETASTFNETMVQKAALKDAGQDEALAILEAEISGCNQVIVDIYSRFLFESRFFEERKKGSLSAQEICDLMRQAQLDSYADGLDPEYLHPYMWTWKPHYYYASRHFYNFPYAFGQLFAKGLYALYEKMGKDFIPLYQRFLRNAGSMSVYDVAQSVGIDVHDKGFWETSLQSIADDIDLFVKLLDKE